MRQQDRMGYAATNGWRMVTLPTASDVVVDVLLPDTGTHLTPETLKPGRGEPERPSRNPPRA